MNLQLATVVGLRCLLVILFLPFSALDKMLNFGGAVAQARQLWPGGATALILVGLAVEILAPIGIVSGVADRLAAFVLGGYCVVTALLWKQFWRPGDFWHAGSSRARDLFWDFVKNCALAGGILLVGFGTRDNAVAIFLAHPLQSTHPYAPYFGGPG